jgi:integral membrane protein (TIGR01906 family)
MKNLLFSVLKWLITLLTPLALIGLALRVLLTPLFLTIEYNMPYFPPDEYGFTKEDRLHWAPFALEYLLNGADTSYLGDLKFEDGSPLFGERELKHLEDVQNIVQGALRVWHGTLAILGAIAVIAWRGKWMPVYLDGLRRGGWWMVGFSVALGLIVGVGITVSPDLFWKFFTLFHSLFFEGDSWLFAYSDTLIRLFPLRFWQDAFLWAAVIALGGGTGLGLGLGKLMRNP